MFIIKINNRSLLVLESASATHIPKIRNNLFFKNIITVYNYSSSYKETLRRCSRYIMIIRVDHAHQYNLEFTKYFRTCRIMYLLLKMDYRLFVYSDFLCPFVYDQKQFLLNANECEWFIFNLNFILRNNITK